MAQNTTSNRGYDDTVYIPRQQRLRPMILTRKVQQFYLVYLCFLGDVYKRQPRWQRNADRRLYDAKRWQLEGE